MKYLALLAALTACADPVTDGPDADLDEDQGAGELPIGDLEDDFKTDDGGWGDALRCKPVPNLTPLVQPKITLSIDGLTLHLQDPVTGFDKVYPVGPGKTETDPNSGEYGESFSYFPIAVTGRQDFQITPSTIQPCKTWLTEDDGVRRPVFAGLPFLSFYGNYGIHGPIDNFRNPQGGTLRRGYVSHGCFRMEAADIVEVYALIKGVAKVPVHLQREKERRPDGSIVDLEEKWVGSSCTSDSECNFNGGFCNTNPLTPGRGFCSARCTSTCADRKGYPTTFCTADPNEPSKGMCVAKSQYENYQCRPYDHFAPKTVARFSNPSVTATACMPRAAAASGMGWVGDHCMTNADCGNGTRCIGARAEVPATETSPTVPAKPGVCSMACDRFCADLPGQTDTFCAADNGLVAGGGQCLRQCSPSSNASECPADMTCEPRTRFMLNGAAALPTTTKYVCVPRP